MVAANIADLHVENHAEALVRLALAFKQAVSQINESGYVGEEGQEEAPAPGYVPGGAGSIELRVGINTGPLTGTPHSFRKRVLPFRAL